MPRLKTAGPGSPDGEPLYLVVGFLRRPHGVGGEIIMDVHTDFPERLTAKKTLFVGDTHQPMTVANTRPHGAGMLVKFKGIDSPEKAGQFRNQWVFIMAKDAPDLPEGQLYQHQLFGLDVIDESDHLLGRITEIIETGANDVYVVTDAQGREVLLPAIPAVILDVDLGRRQMRVHLLDGLIE